jgi:hypothetical protein
VPAAGRLAMASLFAHGELTTVSQQEVVRGESDIFICTKIGISSE